MPQGVARFSSAALAGLLLAFAGLLVAPASTLLPTPGGATRAGAALLLAAVFAVAFTFPVEALLGAVALTILEGAIRRWAVNDIAVFLLKDYALGGVYLAAAWRTRLAGWRRPWWLLAPLGAYLAIALAFCLRSASATQALVGLHAYLLYVPLFFVAPALLRDVARVRLLATGVVVAAVLEVGLGVAQLFSSEHAFVNRLVSGSKLAAITIGDQQYVRPVGTFMQSGSMSAFLGIAALVALSALIVVGRRYVRRRIAVAGMLAIGTGLVITAARALFGGVVAGFVLLAAITFDRPWRRLALPLAATAAGVVVALVVVPQFGPAGGTLLGRSAGLTAGDAGGVWAARIRPPLELIAHQGPVGHGTGAASLGIEYVTGSGPPGAESEYAKVAYELGTAGVVAFTLFVAAVIVACALGYARTRGGGAEFVGAAGLAVSVVVALWMLVTYALDMPVAAELYFTLTGLAAAVRAAPGRA